MQYCNALLLKTTFPNTDCECTEVDPLQFWMMLTLIFMNRNGVFEIISTVNRKKCMWWRRRLHVMQYRTNILHTQLKHSDFRLIAHIYLG